MQITVLRKRRTQDGHFDHDLLLNVQTDSDQYIQLYDVEAILRDKQLERERLRHDQVLQYDAQRDGTTLLLSEFKLILIMVIVFILIMFTIGGIVKTTNWRKCMKGTLSVFGLVDTAASQSDIDSALPPPR